MNGGGLSSVSHSEISARGGKSKSPAKMRASMANLAKAKAAREQTDKTICACSPPAKRLALAPKPYG
jgi:hypothetical protein